MTSRFSVDNPDDTREDNERDEAGPDEPAGPPARTWSPYQLGVFRDIAEGKGHTFVGAVAGSGKSTTMEEGLVHIPAGKTVLVCAFNKEIATAFTGRLARIAPRLQSGVKVECSTLHSYGLRQISRAFGRPEINSDKTWTLLNEFLASEANAGPRRVAKELAVTIVKGVSLAKATLAQGASDVEDLIDGFGLEMGDDVQDHEARYQQRRAWFVSTVLTLLARSKALTGVIDFDDMVWLPVVLNVRLWQFDRVFVDEVQDLNACQIELVLRTVKRDGRVLCVGDRSQAIYAFRAADEHAVEHLIERLRAKELLLSVSYRCSRAVIREAQKIVPRIEHAPNAPEGSVETASEAQMLASVKAGDFVLSRANAPLVGHCLKLLAEGKKAMVAGRDIGKSLVGLIRKSKAEQVGELLAWLEKWADTEILHLSSSDRPKDAQIQAVQDKADTIAALAEGAQSVNEIVAKIEALFSDDTKDEEKIVLSTTHKAKGLERKTVWLLRDTYLKRDTTEERNLLYVAITRAELHLKLVRSGKGGAK